MNQLADFSIKPFVIHTDDVAWEQVGDGLRIKRLLCEENTGKIQYYFGVAELAPGKDIPLQKANLACCTHLLQGEVWSRVGRQRIQMEKEGSNYFPIGVPHAYEASGKYGVRFLFCYATDNAIGQSGLKFEPVSEEEARSQYYPNCPSNLMSASAENTSFRWACAGDGAAWIPVEAGQGSRTLIFQDHFDDMTGSKEFWWGRCHVRPNCRYTPHYHLQSEIFYFLEGKGTMFAGDKTYKVTPGSLVYVPSNCVHGMVNDGAETLVSLYTCNIENTGIAYERYEICDVPLIPPADRDDWMFSQI